MHSPIRKLSVLLGLVLMVVLECAGTPEKSAVVVSETTLFGDMECFRVETPSATYLYGKRGAGFASILDPEGHDWISYRPGNKARGEYRGLPKCGQPVKYFHCGYGFGQYTNDDWFTSTVTVREPTHLRIHCETRKGDSACDWDFFPEHATLTLHRIGLPTFWFLYEGTPGGALDVADDYVIRSSGRRRTPLSEPWTNVTPWVAFGAKESSFALVCVNHQTNSPVDSYVSWPYKREADGSLNDMTVFGFGRPGWTDSGQHQPQLRALPARFSIALCRATNAVALAERLGSGVERRAAGRFDIREFGAKGDGRTLDTAAIQRAIDACNEAEGGQVLLPGGRYLSGTIHLRSGVTLRLDAGARLIGATNLAQYAQPTTPDFMPEAKWGKWHRALIVGQNIEDFAITGEGVIDGNKVFDPTGEEHMRGPHTVAFVGCRRATLHDITIVDAANYAVFFQVSDDVEIRNVKVVGGWDGVHWRGAPERWCHNVNIVGCQFFTGDDAIAGRYWDNTVIKDCLINSSCNGIRLIGPATHLTVANNVFRGPGEQPHRSSGEKRRTNMLSGIILQPGAWDATRGALDDVLIANNIMHRVASPVSLWTKSGNPVGRVTISGLTATDVYRAALSAESWADTPITNVTLHNVQVEFAGGGKAWPTNQRVKGPGVDARPLPAWGLYARNVQTLTLEEVRFSLASDDSRPVLQTERVDHLNLDAFKFTQVPGVTEPLRTNSFGFPAP